MMSKKAHTLLLLLVLAVTLYRVIAFQPTFLPTGTEIDTRVRISQTPKLSGTQQQIKAKEVNKNTAEFIIYTGRYPSYVEGDLLVIKGKVKNYHILSYPKITKEGNTLNEIQKQLLGVRNKFKSAIQRSVPEPHAALILGMLLGVESDIPPKVEDSLKRTGTIHMLVVSGFNITLVSAFIMRLAGFLHRKYTILLAIISIWSFVIIAGAQPPALRAGIMASLALLGSYYGRPTRALYLLLFSMVFLLIVSPELVYSLSFQLSCVATAGIIILPKYIKSTLDRLGNKREGEVQKYSKAKEYFTNEIATTLAAQIAVTPLILNSFGSLSVIAPITNIAVAWSIPYIMITGLCVGLAAFMHSLLGLVAATVSVPFTAYFLKVTAITSTLPFAYFEEIKINLVLSVGIYLILVYAVVKTEKNKNYSKREE